MPKTYFNDAVIGNSKVLATLSKNGELLRLYWPNIDFRQQIDAMYIGLNIKGFTYWLHQDFIQAEQQYFPKTNILLTKLINVQLQISINEIDFVVPDKSIVIRRFIIENKSNDTIKMSLVSYSSGIRELNNYCGVVMDKFKNILIHYTNDNYMGIFLNNGIDKYKLGDSLEEAKTGNINAKDDIIMWHRATIMSKCYEVPPFSKREISLNILLGKTLKEVENLCSEVEKEETQYFQDITMKYWYDYLEDKPKLETKNGMLLEVYERTLLYFPLVCDKEYGGILAAPEVDEEFTKCGRYGYCWGRDAGFVTLALDKCGLTDYTDSFFKWCKNTQLSDGSWQQRYTINGNLAPCWGLQIDEPGTILYGIWKHYLVTKDIKFLESMKDCVLNGAKFLISFIDKETHLPKRSYDLWEEREGIHLYSSSAVYAGLVSASNIMKELNIESDFANECILYSQNLKEKMLLDFWDEKLDRYKRSIYLDEYWKEEITDISLLGLSVPFEILDVNDPKILKTVAKIEEDLVLLPVYGMKRYKDDMYLGENPWVIATLWLGIYYKKAGRIEEAKKILNWAVEYATNLGFLPEQLNKNNGDVVWVTQLTWSHAMFVILADELREEL